MHDYLTVSRRCTCQPSGAHVKSGCLSALERCAKGHEPLRPRGAKPTGFGATDFISAGRRGQCSEWKFRLVHLNIAHLDGPQLSRDSG